MERILYLSQRKDAIIKYRTYGGNIMDICYNKLFKLLIDKGLRKMEFAKNAGISQNTMAKLSKNQYVSMKVLVKICRALDCSVDEMMDILPEGEEYK